MSYAFGAPIITPPTCPPGQRFKEGTLICVPTDGPCTVEGQREVLVGNMYLCECPEGQTVSLDGQRCVPKRCPEGQILDIDSMQCVPGRGPSAKPTTGAAAPMGGVAVVGIVALAAGAWWLSRKGGTGAGARNQWR
jgi:hypothetical protein